LYEIVETIGVVWIRFLNIELWVSQTSDTFNFE